MSLAAKRDKDKKGSKEEDEVKAALKAGTWKEVKDGNGKTYYYNPTTKKTTWDLKKELKKEKEAAAGGSASSSSATKPAAEPAPGPGLLKPSSAKSTDKPASTPAASTAATTPADPNSNKTQQQKLGGQSTAASSSVGPASPAGVTPTTQAIQQGGLASSSYQGPVTDSMQQLLEENAQIRQLLASGSNGQVALDFQARYDAVLRTNQALTVQTERMKHEYDAMARALTEANKKIHELELQANTTTAGIQDRTKDEEIQLTLTHLREQKRALVTQISELSTLLARGLNENAIAAAGLRANAGLLHTQHGNSAAQDTGATLFTRFLDSSARQVLCPTCTLSISQMRDRMLNPSETNAGSRMGGRTAPGQALGEDATPMYTQVSDITTPPPTFHYSAQPHQVGANPPAGSGFGTQYQYGVPPASGGSHPGIGSSRGPSAGQHTTLLTSSGPSSSGHQHQHGGNGVQEVPGVMYNGFIVKNPRGL